MNEQSSQTVPGYQEIGGVLLIGESTYLTVGVPWLPPTQRIRGRVSQDGLSSDEFFRVMLVNIPTATLEVYLDDLCTVPPNSEGSRTLGVGGISWFEQFALAPVVFLLCFTVLFLGSIWAQLGVRLALSFGVVGAALSALLAASFCTERNRRSSFHWHIQEELHRRRGMLHSSPGPVLPLRVEPIAE